LVSLSSGQGDGLLPEQAVRPKAIRLNTKIEFLNDVFICFRC
jgi:hypothetical protein